MWARSNSLRLSVLLTVHLVHIPTMLRLEVVLRTQVLAVWRGKGKVRGERRPPLLLLWRRIVVFLQGKRRVTHSSMTQVLSRDERRRWRVVERTRWVWVGVVAVRM